VALAHRGLPRRVAPYFHSLEQSGYRRFEECVNYLRDNGYEFVGPERFVAGSTSHLAFLSFDDNYRTWYEALPLLDRLGIRATFYVNTLPLRDSASEGVIGAYFDLVHHYDTRVPLDASEVRALQ